MANIDINSGQTYFFSRSQNSTFIMDSTDHSHAPKVFGNQLIVSASNSPSDAEFFFKTQDSNSYAFFQRIGSTAVSTPLVQITGRSVTNDESAAIKFTNGAAWTIGLIRDSSATNRDFQITDGSSLSANPTTATNVGMAIKPLNSGTMAVHFPNLGTTGTTIGSNSVRFNTTTFQLLSLTSTSRIKKDIISPSSSIYDNVLNIQPRYFKSIKPEDGEEPVLSFIAEELADVMPELATYGPDWKYDDRGNKIELQSDKQVPIDINERTIIALLVGKIQDLESRLQQLESQ